MSEIPESKKPFDFYQSPWWKDMSNKLCVDGWPQIVVALNCMVIEAKSEYEQLQKQNQELIKALEFYADGDNWGYIAPDKVDYRVIEKSDFGIGEFQLTELTDDEWVGGRRAREVLTKFSKGDL